MRERFDTVVIEDCAHYASVLSAVLTDMDVQHSVFESVEEADAHVDWAQVKNVVTDCLLPGKSGLWLAKRLQEQGHAVNVVFMTGASDPGNLTKLWEMGCVVSKTEHLSVIIQKMRRFIGAHSEAHHGYHT